MSKPRIVYKANQEPYELARALVENDLVVALLPPGKDLSLYHPNPRGGVSAIASVDKLAALVEFAPFTFAASAPEKRLVFSALLLNPGLWTFDDLQWTVDTLITCPTVRPTPAGYVSPRRGRDPALRLYSTADPIAPSPAPAHLQELLGLLRLPPRARARYVAFLLAVLLRPALRLAPGLLMRSPHKNTGKSTLCELAAALYYDDPAPKPSQWHGNTEVDKVLGGLVERGQSFLWLDNLAPHDGIFRSAGLAGLLTTDHYDVRKLRNSSMLTVDYPLVAASMQCGTVDRDLTDRFLHCYLPEPPPPALTTDARVYAQTHFRVIRSELFGLLQAAGGPLPTAEHAPTRFRYHDLWRHAAPVLSHLGLDPTDLEFDDLLAAMPEFLEAARLLVQAAGPVSPRDLVSRVRQSRRSPALLSLLDSDIPDCVACVRAAKVLTELPSAVADKDQTYLISQPEAGTFVGTLKEKPDAPTDT